MECGLIDHITVLFANNPRPKFVHYSSALLVAMEDRALLIMFLFLRSHPPPALHVQRVDLIIVTHVCVWKRTMYCIGSTFQSE